MAVKTRRAREVANFQSSMRPWSKKQCKIHHFFRVSRNEIQGRTKRLFPGSEILRWKSWVLWTVAGIKTQIFNSHSHNLGRAFPPVHVLLSDSAVWQVDQCLSKSIFIAEREVNKNSQKKSRLDTARAAPVTSMDRTIKLGRSRKLECSLVPRELRNQAR